MNSKKSKYQSPAMQIVEVGNHALLGNEASTGQEGPATSRSQRPDWDEE